MIRYILEADSFAYEAVKVHVKKETVFVRLLFFLYIAIALEGTINVSYLPEVYYMRPGVTIV